MHTLKNITTTLIITLLLSFTGFASATLDVNLKTASGVENLAAAGYQQKTAFNWLINQGEIDFSYDDALGSSVAAKGLAGNPMFKNAVSQFKNGKFTNAGRALTKHPNIVGSSNAQALTKQFGNQQGINTAAANALKNIMRNGAQSTKNTKAFGKVTDFKLSNGLGARFNATTNEFITFLGRGL